MTELNETLRKFAYPNITQVGADLVLTTRSFFVILTPEDIDKIKKSVIAEGKSIYIHKETILVYLKDNYVILEKLKSDNDQRHILMVSINKL